MNTKASESTSDYNMPPYGDMVNLIESTDNRTSFRYATIGNLKVVFGHALVYYPHQTTSTDKTDVLYKAYDGTPPTVSQINNYTYRKTEHDYQSSSGKHYEDISSSGTGFPKIVFPITFSSKPIVVISGFANYAAFYGTTEMAYAPGVYTTIEVDTTYFTYGMMRYSLPGKFYLDSESYGTGLPMYMFNQESRHGIAYIAIGT